MKSTGKLLAFLKKNPIPFMTLISSCSVLTGLATPKIAVKVIKPNFTPVKPVTEIDVITFSGIKTYRNIFSTMFYFSTSLKNYSIVRFTHTRFNSTQKNNLNSEVS